MELDFNALRELLAAIDQTDVAEFTLKNGDFELVVRKGAQPSYLPSPSVVPGELIAPAPVAPPAPSSAIAASPTPVAASAPPALPKEKLIDITSPMVGTFYRSPAPDEPPYADVGDRIKTGQVVCIVEAMKLMNEVESEVSGEIVEILVQNAQPVEYGQVLMRVNPS